MSFDGNRSGYRQPAQARVFAGGALVAIGLLAMLLLSIHLIAPPLPTIDAGQTVAFVAESIPVDPPAPAPRTPSPPDPQPPLPTAAPPAPATAARAPTIAIPSLIADAPVVLPGPTTSDLALPPSPRSDVRPVQRSVPAAPAVPVAAAADWRAQLVEHLKRFRRYPRHSATARQQGVARVAITLRRSGEVIAVELIHGSGYPLLDIEARTTVRRASPLPAVDEGVPGDPVTVEVPIDFKLRR